MHLQHHKSASHTPLDLSASDDLRLHVVEASGRNLQVDTPARWITLWLPLSGTVEMLIVLVVCPAAKLSLPVLLV